MLRTSAPGADPHKLNLIKHKTASLGGRDSYLTDQSNKLASRAAIYFSARKHQAAQGGAEGLMREMRYSLLNGIRERVQTHKNQAK